jgi:hypothetical protein
MLYFNYTVKVNVKIPLKLSSCTEKRKGRDFKFYFYFLRSLGDESSSQYPNKNVDDITHARSIWKCI